MSDPIPVVLIPGLLASPRLKAEQLPQLWSIAPVTVAAHTRDETKGAIPRRILAAAPPEFALVGLSMGGYISFEIMRVAAERVVKLALLDTSARPDLPEQSETRRAQIADAKAGRLLDVLDRAFPTWVRPGRRGGPAGRAGAGAGAREGGV